jgi:hypothetical protein
MHCYIRTAAVVMRTHHSVMLYLHLLSCYFNHLKPTGYMMHQQFNIHQLYVLPTLYLCVLHLSENKLTCS